MVKFNRSSAIAVVATAVMASGCLMATPATAGTAVDVYLAATLLGDNEVGTGDKDGGAIALFHITGNKIEYAVQWRGTEAPTAFHIHQGKAGKDGKVAVPFFGEQLPGRLNAVAGVARADSGLLKSIAKNPKNWYANLHTAEFPDGAVRAQLRRVPKVDLDSLLDVGAKTAFSAVANAEQEVREPGKKVGDKSGVAVWLVWLKGTKVHFATLWQGIGAPTNAHLHRGKKGKNGPVAVDFFAASGGLPAGVTGVAGSVNASSSIIKGIKQSPKNWYTNLHTAEFPDGAVRGQLAKGGW
ncbi:CHRD domain-containing protein [Nonomuraea africana]|uniref:CHRD domain-containing protein n=1 Tax=Nonomuraea africana TaxID=46171 RepID=A0ABR9KS01_9ACTN|nr:CHRD domain-containing protein [Nonomuraea africana]MBE1564802.1 hypothetical protein [Nonomuraea africana]